MRPLTDPRSLAVAFALALSLPLAAAPAVGAADGADALRDRIEDLHQEISSLEEDIDDLREPVAEFELFDQCMFLMGVTQYGTSDGRRGYVYGRGGVARRPALAMDMAGFGAPAFHFLAFPQEEPPSIECNEDAGQEDIDD